MLGLWQTNWRAAGFPFAARLEELHALETLEDGTLATNGAAGLKAVVLGHDGKWFGLERGARKLGASRTLGNPKIPAF